MCFSIPRFLVITLSLLSAGCACSGTSEYLTVGVGWHEEDGGGVMTTPNWNATWEQVADQRFEASASWGFDDPSPEDGLYEIYERVDGALQPVDLDVATCTQSEPGQSPEGPECASIDGSHSCPAHHRFWRPTETWEEGESYRLVFYPDRGNGKTLSWDGERTTFEGNEVLVMDIEVIAPLGEI